MSSNHNAIQGDFGETWLEVVASGCGLLHGWATTLDLDKADVQLTLRGYVDGTYSPTVLVQVKTEMDLRDDVRPRPPSLDALRDYLENSGWSLVDEDARTSMWRPNRSFTEELFVVLPLREEVKDYSERSYEALRVVAYVERRSIDEISSDMTYGAADSVAARLIPEAPPGEAPLSLA